MDIQTAHARLATQLPLKARQDQLSATLKSAHQLVLTSLVKQGRPPNQAELMAVVGEENLTAGLRRLGADDLIVLDQNGKLPVGAYPVTSEITPHKISVNGHCIYAMCALDAVSVAPMFNTRVLIESTCQVSRKPICIHMHGSDVVEAQPSAEVTIGIRWQMPSAVAAHSMCMQMVFLKDRQTASIWRQGDPGQISLFTLPDAVALGKAFFLPLFD
jgi:hypothetical protein